MQPSGYRLVRLATGIHSVHSEAHGETFHPVIGPEAEAEALYVRQLRLPERVALHSPGPFVIWDVGLGAAANVLTVLRATRHCPAPVQIVSFDHTREPLAFALQHRVELGYFHDYEDAAATLLRHGSAWWEDGGRRVDWRFHEADFPTLLEGWTTGAGPHRPAPPPRPEAPHAILYDAFSPARNAAMWTQPHFRRLFQMLDPGRPCAMPTYSRSTSLRVSLLLAGFFVGSGHATGEKEETTIAANVLSLLSEPLDARWLGRARRSTSAEPLWTPVYRQAPLSAATWEKLQAHPQFR